jgi:hypothetical protein
MKPSLGKIFFIWILTIGQVWGVYQWSIHEAPKSLMVGESGVIRYQCAFDTSAGDYTIEFRPSEVDAYRASILTQRDQIVEGKRVQTFDVLITPKYSGEIEVRFDALMRHTTFASIENATIGRDNVKKYDFNDEKVYLPQAVVHVSESPAALSGKLILEVSSDVKRVRAHEPLHVSVVVRGKGNMDQILPYELNISGVTVFSQPSQKSVSPSVVGYEGEVSQEFALVAEKSYTIPALTLQFFDTEKNQVVTLRSNPIYVEVEEGYELSSLLDVPEINDYRTLKHYGWYAFFTLLGIALNEAVRWGWKRRPRRKKRIFWESASTVGELVQLLALSGEKRFDEVIAALEEEKMDVREAKKRLIQIDRSDCQFQPK